MSDNKTVISDPESERPRGNKSKGRKKPVERTVITGSAQDVDPDEEDGSSEDSTIIRIQGAEEKRLGIYYEYDSSLPPLGKGGMGKVYRGWYVNERTNHRREVAIKFLYSVLPPHVIARARREASVQLRNDNLIEMLGFVEVEDNDILGQPYKKFHVVSEYLHGVTLDRLLEGEVTDTEGKVIPYAQGLYDKSLNNPYEFALTIVRSVLSGLIALHDAGYIHRDIDPSNIMVTSDRKIKLIDYGIAKNLKSDQTDGHSFTIDGQFIGKPKYAAPELVRGLVDSQNFTTDIYAVGILLYQLLVGKVPFEGQMAEVLEMQINQKLPLQNVKQKQIREVIAKATSKKRAQRYQSAAEFRVAMDRLTGLPYPAKGINWKLLVLCGAGAAAIAGLALGIIALTKNNDKTVNEDIILVETLPADGPDGATARYSSAKELLASKETAQKGLEELEALAAQGDYQANFLLSRLHFSSSQSFHVGAFTDSVNLFRKNLSMPADNREAHRLLRKAVAINPNDYRSLFELGTDFKSQDRGVARDLDSAYIYLDRARTLAREADDRKYLQLINDRLSNLQPPKK